MIKNLYDEVAKRWYRGGSIYFYGDTHFGSSVYGITDEQRIKKINQRLGRQDTIVILGDVGDVDKVKQIRGYKVLILGNHDRGATYYKDYFNEVYEGPLMIASNIILSHTPIKDCKFALNIHGHDHAGNAGDELHINAAANKINFKPICIKDIVASGKLKNAENLNRSAIDRAVERKAEGQIKMDLESLMEVKQ